MNKANMILGYNAFSPSDRKQVDTLKTKYLEYLEDHKSTSSVSRRVVTNL